jgi:hypothetical protein
MAEERIEEHAECSAAGRDDDPITHYRELARDARLGVTMALTRSLPCCLSSGGRLCGRGATVGYMVPQANGTWIVMPICETCVRAMVVSRDTARRR